MVCVVLCVIVYAVCVVGVRDWVLLVNLYSRQEELSYWVWQRERGPWSRMAQARNVLASIFYLQFHFSLWDLI